MRLQDVSEVLVLVLVLVLEVVVVVEVVQASPRWDPTTRLQEGLVPADAAVDSIIYRLRATDPAVAYPLTFTVTTPTITVTVEGLRCSAFNSLCHANVVLRRRLEVGRYYDFTVQVTNTRGESASMNCSFRATNATTPMSEIFPNAPSLLTVSEGARRNTELGGLLARGNPGKQKPVLLELWGSPKFGIYQRTVNGVDAQATLILLAPLDYETTTVHHLTILANDPWTESGKDTRNIASWPVIVAVLDEQDTPPVFTLAPPTTTLSPGLTPGDLILNIHAEDGDRGKPRDIRYGLVPEGNPFVTFFDISEDTGELRLAKPLPELMSIARQGQPILLTVQAEEVRANPQEAPAQSSTVVLALIPPGVRAGSPVFGSAAYTTLLDENAPTGTRLQLPQAEVRTQPGDVITLSLENNNDTFEIAPGVVEGHADFAVKVHDPRLLDYEERRSVECYIVAKELGTGNFTARAKLTVLLNDVNDNDPEFVRSEFVGKVQENADVGTTVTRVEAVDRDSLPARKIRYTRLNGVGSNLFNLDGETGLITVANSLGLDAEVAPVFRLQVEAADEDGFGRTATASVVIELIDINDQPPEFERQLYEFIVNQEKTGFTVDAAVIRATDKDISPPNNEVHYELIDKIDDLVLDEKTGELSIVRVWTREDVVELRARAWDGGVPRLSTECGVKIYPPDGQTRRMVFIVPGSNPDKKAIAHTLRTVTGGKVVINEIRPYTTDDVYSGRGDFDDEEKSVVVATVSFPKNAIIDVNRIQKLLDEEHQHHVVHHRETTETRITNTETTSSGSLLWVILIVILLIIAAIICILCCICPPCPLYIPPKKRRRTVTPVEVEKLVVKGSGHGLESKSVQVAEWFGRREAWSPEQVLIDNEVESLRRHEMERGSDQGGRRSLNRQPQIPRVPSRDQLYIREGNADILRLITRGNEAFQTQPPQQIPVTLVADQAFMTDTGKDILMQRFIEQQQAEARSQILLPNAVTRLQQEQELLEASLRQQHALLRQILIERERDLRLETQSLPAGTQTDQDAYTQTEPIFLEKARKSLSDNDASDLSDEELAIIKARIKNKKMRRRSQVKRQIKTPIQEESEVEVIAEPKKIKSVGTSAGSTRTGTSANINAITARIKQTRTSELRQRAGNEIRHTRSAIRKEILQEITASLDAADSASDDGHKKLTKKNDTTGYVHQPESYAAYSDDSLEEISPRSEEKTTTDSGKQKYHSETDLRDSSSKSRKKMNKSQSQVDLSAVTASSTASKIPVKRSSRYMEWYNNKVDAKATGRSRSGSYKMEEKSNTSNTTNKKKKGSTKTIPARRRKEVKEVKDVKEAREAKEARETKDGKEVRETKTEIEKEAAMKEIIKIENTSIPGQSSEASKESGKKESEKKQGPEHRLLQHSEYRFEAPYPLIRRPEEDTDSGIALTRPAMAQKKSIFTIAYDDIHKDHLRLDSSTPPL